MITLNLDGLERDPLRRFQWTRAAVAWADEAGITGRTALKAKAPVGKGPNAGRLRDSIRYQRTTAVGRGITVSFTAHTPYAGFVIGGTRPHRIEARAAKALHWVGPHGDVFRRSVWHPGTRPNPFPRKAMLPLMPHLQRRYAEIVLAEFRRA